MQALSADAEQNSHQNEVLAPLFVTGPGGVPPPKARTSIHFSCRLGTGCAIQVWIVADCQFDALCEATTRGYTIASEFPENLASS